MNALVMYDHETRSLWSQFLGQAVRGQFAGTKLEFIPALLTDWATWVGLHPDTKALDKGGSSGYDPYFSYYGSGAAGVLGETVIDDRLPTKEFVVGLEKEGEAMAYPYRLLNQTPVVNDRFQEVPIVIAFDPGPGTAVVYRREVDGQPRTFRLPDRQGEDQSMMVDAETGSRWIVLTGEAVEGPMAGTVLERFRFHLTFWFAWKDYYPDTQVYGQ